MLQGNRFNANFTILFLFCLLCPVLSDVESGFSQGCYSACPRKIWTLQNSSREQVDREWIECLKQCHQINSWKFIAIVCGVVLIIAILCIIVYVCWGQRIRLKYTFHVERKKRTSINSEDQTKINVFEQGLKKFKQIMTEHHQEICIEFENDDGLKKKFSVEDAIFHHRQNHSLENMFSIILVNKKQLPPRQLNSNLSEIQDQSQNQIKNQSKIYDEEYSQLIGAISFTSKGLNLWWIKIDQKPQEADRWCKLCSRKNKKYFAVYEKDPFAPEGSFIGNVVLQDSSKQADQRYTKYVIKRKEPFEMVHFEQKVIET